MPARIVASPRHLTLLTTGAALLLTTACGANSAEVPRTVLSTQQTTSAPASTSAESSATPTSEISPAEATEPTEAETTGEETPTEEAPVEETAEPETDTQEPTEEEAPAEEPAPDSQQGEDQSIGETGAREDAEQTITEADEQPTLANPAEESQQSTGQVQELDVEGSVFYETCETAAEEGVSHILEGTPGYRAELDEDGNGVACES